jgi:hypothetical protein
MPPAAQFPLLYCPILLQVLFAWELQRRTGGKVVSVALHPGEVLTDVVRSLPGGLQKAYRLLLQTILLTPQQGEWRGGQARQVGRQRASASSWWRGSTCFPSSLHAAALALSRRLPAPTCLPCDPRRRSLQRVLRY